MHCGYCDELGKDAASMHLDEVIETLARLDQEEGPHSFVSLTGGEPLLYLTFLKPLMERLKTRGLRAYLETSGVLWRALAEVLELCDVIAMDMKPSSVTGEPAFENEHARFLELARSRETFVKIVLSKAIDLKEFDRLIGIVEKTAPKTPVILQPLSGVLEGHEDPELMALLDSLQRLALKRVPDVRIVPRLHKILKIR